MPRVAFRNFTGGEVTPTLSARYDLKKFGSFLQVCRNFIPNLHGDIERRPGFRWVDTLDEGAILVPFMYNTEVENNYVLLFRFDGRIDVAGVRCGEDGRAVHPIEYVPLGVATMRHGYASPKELYELSYAQVADVLYIAHPNHALSKVTRSGAFPYVWSFESVTINKSLPKPVGLKAQWVSGNAEDTVEPDYDLYYVVSAVDAEGVESLPSEPGIAKGKYATDWVVGNHVDLSWEPVPGADHYRVYRVAAGYYGLISVVKQPDEGYVSFQDNNIEADVSITPKEDWNPFLEKDENGEDRINNPATICFHNQRMWLGGGSLHPATLYASKTGDFESFRKSLPLRDDDPLEFMLASGSVDDIKWLSSFDNLLIGTAGSEYKASASSGAITPTDCHVTAQSYWGSSGLQPLLIGQSILHAQRANQHVRDLYYTWESDSYTGNDLSLLAPQLVEEYDLYQWCFQQSPGSCLWIARSDGVLLCLTYMKEQNVFGWSVHELGGNGKAISVAVINGEREDVVFAVVQRGDVYTLERLERRFSDADGIEDSFYLDCARTFEGNGLTSIGGTETITQTWKTAEVVTSSESEPYEPPSAPASDDNTQYSGGSSAGVKDENGMIVGTSGADTIMGTEAGDVIKPGGGSDVIYAGGGDDTIRGGTGSRTIYGGAGNDIIYTPGDGGVSYGEDGNDTLYGGTGNVTLYGGAGNNLFDISPAYGQITIADAKSTDRIKWTRGGLAGTSFSVTQTADGNDLVVGFDGNSSLRLVGWIQSSDRPAQIEVEGSGTPITLGVGGTP